MNAKFFTNAKENTDDSGNHRFKDSPEFELWVRAVKQQMINSLRKRGNR